MANLKITVKIIKNGDEVITTLIPHLNAGDTVTWIPEGGTIKKIKNSSPTDLFTGEPQKDTDNNNWTATVKNQTGVETYKISVSADNSTEAVDVDPQLQIDQGATN